MPHTLASQAPRLLRAMFGAAVDAALPERILPPLLPPPPRPGGRLIVIGAGKAAARMAQATLSHYRSLGVDVIGRVVTRYGHAVPCGPIEVLEAAHPVPDDAGLHATGQIRALVSDLTPQDVVIALISGGGSALLVEPAPGLTLGDKQIVHQALLRSGASIREMNCVRRHLSAVKGGRLGAQCHPAQLHTLLISDVPGDVPSDIASGPTVADPTTRQDALDILRRYRLDVPAAVWQVLESETAETLKPGDARLAGHRCTRVATPRQSLNAAAEIARAAGVTPWILGDDLEGEARAMGTVMAGLTRQCARHQHPFVPPCVLLSGGESTVTLPAVADDQPLGSGGRNVEFLLSMGLALQGEPGVWALAADTDGIDGVAPVAGALLYPDTLQRAWKMGRQPLRDLECHNGHGFFGALGDAVTTGPTLTNVNDFRAILILPRASGTPPRSDRSDAPASPEPPTAS